MTRAFFAKPAARAFALSLVALIGCGPSAPPKVARRAPLSSPTVEVPPPPLVVEPTDREPTHESVAEDEELVRGRSTVRVDAPLDRVRAAVLRFNDYASFMPHYRASRVIDKTADRTKVYMQIAALHGLVRMGAQIWFPNAPETVDGWLTYASSFESGNVDDFKAIWRLKPIDEAHTLLSLEVFLSPRLPLPVSERNKENLAGALRGALAMRDRIEHP